MASGALPRYDVLKHWSVIDVTDWFKKAGYAECERPFQDKNINGVKLLTLKETDLFHMPMIPIKKRGKIMEIIQKVEKDGPSGRGVPFKKKSPFRTPPAPPKPDYKQDPDPSLANGGSLSDADFDSFDEMTDDEEDDVKDYLQPTECVVPPPQPPRGNRPVPPPPTVSGGAPPPRPPKNQPMVKPAPAAEPEDVYEVPDDQLPQSRALPPIPPPMEDEDKTSGGSMESRPLPPRPDKNKKPVVPNKSALHPPAPKKGPPSPNRGPSLPVPDTKPAQPKSFLHTTDNPTVKELRQKLNEQHIIGATSPNPAPAKNKQVTPFAKEPNNNKEPESQNPGRFRGVPKLPGGVTAVPPVPPPVHKMPSRENMVKGRPLPVPPPLEKENTQQDDLDGYPWYHGPIIKSVGDRKILDCGKSGCYLVRKSARGGGDEPYTLVLFYNNRTFNLRIRLRPDKRYALGKKKDDEQTFATVPDLINHHKSNILILAPGSGGSEAGGETTLSTYLRR